MRSPRDDIDDDEGQKPARIQRPFPIPVGDGKVAPAPQANDPHIAWLRWGVTAVAAITGSWFLIAATGAANDSWSWLQALAPGVVGAVTLYWAIALWQQYIDAEEGRRAREDAHRNRQNKFRFDQPQGPINQNWGGEL